MRTSVWLALAVPRGASCPGRRRRIRRRACRTRARPISPLAGKPPARNRGLTFCTEYGASTCCDRATSDGVRRVVAHMQANGFSSRCREVRRSSRSLQTPRSDPYPPPISSAQPPSHRAPFSSSLALPGLDRAECASSATPVRGSHPRRPCVRTRATHLPRVRGRVLQRGRPASAMVPCRRDRHHSRRSSPDRIASPEGRRQRDVRGGRVRRHLRRSCLRGRRMVFRGAPQPRRRAGTSARPGSSRSTKSKKKGAGGSAAEAEEFARLSGWMTRVYVAAGIGLAAHFGFEIPREEQPNAQRRRRQERGEGRRREPIATRRRV